MDKKSRNHDQHAEEEHIKQLDRPFQRTASHLDASYYQEDSECSDPRPPDNVVCSFSCFFNKSSFWKNKLLIIKSVRIFGCVLPFEDFPQFLLRLSFYPAIYEPENSVKQGKAPCYNCKDAEDITFVWILCQGKNSSQNQKDHGKEYKEQA